jgi:hypothetical protein
MRNNLDDVIRKNIATTAHNPSIARPKVRCTPGAFPLLSILQSFKFKPAIATSSASSHAGVSQAVKASSASLPSFSTPGFGKLRPGSTQARQVVSISSDSNPSSPRSSKRTSSDTSLTFDASPQSSKRLKRECLAEKENIFHPIQCTKSKGKGKAPRFPSPVKSTECIDDETWKKSTLDLGRNPWAKLDLDFPSHCLAGPSSDGLVVPDCDSDLLSVRHLCFGLDRPNYVYIRRTLRA